MSRLSGGIVLLVLSGCLTSREPPSDLPVLADAAVVAYWLGASDSIPDSTRTKLREEFRRSNREIEAYLEDTDIRFLATGSDSILVHEEQDDDWIVVFAGRSLPFGYALIEPGYEEEVLPGLADDAVMKSTIDEYFELEPVDSTPRRRIAARVARTLLTAAAIRVPARSFRAWRR